MIAHKYTWTFKVNKVFLALDRKPAAHSFQMTDDIQAVFYPLFVKKLFLSGLTGSAKNRTKHSKIKIKTWNRPKDY